MLCVPHARTSFFLSLYRVLEACLCVMRASNKARAFDDDMTSDSLRMIDVMLPQSTAAAVSLDIQ